MPIKQTAKMIAMISKLEDVTIYFTDLRDKLQEKYDSRSSSWQEGDAGQQLSEDVSGLDNIVNSLEQATQEIEDVVEFD